MNGEKSRKYNEYTNENKNVGTFYILVKKIIPRKFIKKDPTFCSSYLET